MNGLRNQRSRVHSSPRSKVPPWERIVLETNGLENECSISQILARTGGVVEPVKIFLSSNLITMQNLIAVCHHVGARRRC